ncbi:HAD family hydrolase [Leptolyngbya sp. NIES-3755]|nr:HAD family hydrolase [Leptolyngbya sp. NIES-3755]
MKVAFWLIPSDRDFYQSLIHDLAQRYNAPIFQPHVTLYSGNFEHDRILEFAQTSIEIVLEIDRIRYSNQFTKTLFIQLVSNLQLEQLSQSIQAFFGSPYSLDPHLSLIYARLNEAEQRSLSKQIQLRDQAIHFDRLTAIEIPTKPQTREDIEAWREITS